MCWNSWSCPCACWSFNVQRNHHRLPSWVVSCCLKFLNPKCPSNIPDQSESISFWYFPNSKGHYLVIMVIYPQCPAHVPLSPWHLRWHTAGHRPLGRMSFLKTRRWCTCCLPESAHQILRLTKGLMISHVPNWYDDKDWSYIPRWSNVPRRYTNYYKCV